MSGMAHELTEAGIEYRGIDEHSSFDMTLEEACNIETDPDIGAVLVGFDIKICYHKIAFAKLHLDHPECLFIATNTDSTFPGGNGVLIPGGGSVVKMIECTSNKEPVVVGKPSQWFLDKIINDLSLDRNRTVMVGDRLDTDILFGREGNLKTLLVYSGVTSESDIEVEKDIIPDYAAQTVTDILTFST